MFCDVCGTVLSPKKECVNCNKKEEDLQVRVSTQVMVNSQSVG